MNRRWKVTIGAVCAIGLLGSVSGQKLPDGKGKAELLHDCTVCHDTDTIVQQRRTPEDWKKVVDDMVARGAEGTPEDIDNIIRYLSTNFGAEKTGGATATQSATPPVPKPRH